MNSCPIEFFKRSSILYLLARIIYFLTFSISHGQLNFTNKSFILMVKTITYKKMFHKTQCYNILIISIKIQKKFNKKANYNSMYKLFSLLNKLNLMKTKVEDKTINH